MSRDQSYIQTSAPEPDRSSSQAGVHQARSSEGPVGRFRSEHRCLARFIEPSDWQFSSLPICPAHKEACRNQRPRTARRRYSTAASTSSTTGDRAAADLETVGIERNGEQGAISDIEEMAAARHSGRKRRRATAPSARRRWSGCAMRVRRVPPDRGGIAAEDDPFAAGKDLRPALRQFPCHLFPERRRGATGVRDMMQDTRSPARAGRLENDRAVGLPRSRRARSARHTTSTAAPPATAIFFSLSGGEEANPLAVRRKEGRVRLLGASEGGGVKLIELAGRTACCDRQLRTTNTAALTIR